MQRNNTAEYEFVAAQLRKPSGEAARQVGEKMDRVNEPLFDLTLKTMMPIAGNQVLEIGFGTGKFLHKVIESGQGVKVFGIDYSPEMVEQATRFNRSYIDSGNLTLEKGSSQALSWQNETFDKVYCNMVIFFWDEPAEHLREVLRILKPGGRFYTGFRPKNSMINFPFVQYGFNLYTKPQWQRILEDYGFEHILTTSQSDSPAGAKDGEPKHNSVCIAARKPWDS